MKFNAKKELLFLLIWMFAAIELFGQTLAFPGAEGFGRFTRGGRGGEIYEVTNLNDSGPGSLREAVEAEGKRIVVFRVSGTIKLESPLKIKNPYITIAGQTAPGDGVCIRDYVVNVRANHVIIRYLRFRLGDETGVDTDALWGRYYKNIIIDHCSVSWSVDEAMSFYANDSMTVQWCLVSESLYMSNHPKGAHGYGGIWGGRNVTFHHNLLAHHSSRNPRFAGGETPACENVDFRNNVIYNWGFNSSYGGEGGKINMVANYYKAGPATKSSVRNRIVEPYDILGRWYIEGNYVDGYPEISADNWAGGVQGSAAIENIIRVHEPFPYDTVTWQSAEEAYELVLENVGANYPKRDPVDTRIISEVRSGTATYEGKYYEIIQGFEDISLVRGIIDSQNDVGGWPELVSMPAPKDSDHDGMPDDWELAHDLNPNDDSDRNLTDSQGYTMVEKYINGLVDSLQTYIVRRSNPVEDFKLNQNYPNPFNPATTIAFHLPAAGKVEVDVFDLQGKNVRRIYHGHLSAGRYAFQWQGKNDKGQRVASGIYFCRVRFKNQQKIIKMHYLR